MIELLLVIAILGVLAVVVLIALNPVQQLARTRDAGRSSAVNQLGHAIEAYAVTHNGVYPTDGAGCATGGAWITNCLVNTGEIQTTPGQLNYTAGGTACGGGVSQNSYCYDGSDLSAVVYAGAEADSNTSQCTGTTPNAYFVYSTAAGRGGLWCGGGAPTAGVTAGFVQ